MAYSVLILSALAGALFGQTYKRKANLGLNTESVLAWFSINSLILLSAVVVVFGVSEISIHALWVPFVHGIAMAAAMHSYYRVIERNRLGISWTVIQLSVVIPFLTSVLVYDEGWGADTLLGLVFVIVALFAFGIGRDARRSESMRGTGNRMNVILLTSASVFSGVTSALLRVFSEYHPEPDAIPTFFLLVSLTLTAVNLPLCLWRCHRFGYSFWNRQTISFSAYKSVANMSAMGLLLLATGMLPGFFVFPVRSTLNILFILAISAAVHHERITKFEGLGVGCSIVGIALLSYAMQ